MTKLSDNEHKLIKIGAKREILREGEIGGDIYVIKAGHVEVTKLTSSGSVSLAKLGPGEIFGTITALTGKQHTASVTAISDVELMLISKESLKDLRENIPVWVKIVMQDLMKRLVDMDDLYLQAVKRLRDNQIDFEFNRTP